MISNIKHPISRTRAGSLSKNITRVKKMIIMKFITSITLKQAKMGLWILISSRLYILLFLDFKYGVFSNLIGSSLTNSNSPLQKREMMYLLSIGYYRSGDYSMSRQLLDQCLEIVPDWRQALSLKKTVEDRITKDGVIGIGITATAVRLIAGGIAAALVRKN
ncbi:hypothetical protein ACJIZ3_000566 [Penstemon smallii]|uniref:Mitochondrial fission 1 protein n=1 Tax=Penstemon smallii TaxID=265156 RepID=A0ABD3R115_9LAMI